MPLTADMDGRSVGEVGKGGYPFGGDIWSRDLRLAEDDAWVKGFRAAMMGSEDSLTM
jgi:hypothetical protein